MLMNRYLTKMCDQVIALLSTKHTTSIVWGGEDSDTESEAIDIDESDTDRRFSYKVTKRIEQEESATLRSAFKVDFSSIRPDLTVDLFKINSQYISHHIPPANCPVAPSIFVPSLLHGEISQGFWTASYVRQTIRSVRLGQLAISKVYMKRLL